MTPQQMMKVPAAVGVLLLLWGSAKTVSAASGYVADAAGRRVMLSAAPRRIVSLAPSITEIVYALGRGDRLVGVTAFSDYPPSAKELPKVGSYKRPDLERIVALNPDLCIGISDGNPMGVLQRLAAFDIPVYTADPRNLTSVIGAIREIGGLLGAYERAVTLARDLQQRLDRVQHQVARIGYRPRVFFQIGMNPIVSVGSDTFINELIELAGGRNAARGPILYPRFNREQVLALSPDVLIITSMAREGGFRKEKAAWLQWPQMPAVGAGRVHLVDSDVFDRPSPRLLDGLDILVRLLHPDIGKRHP